MPRFEVFVASTPSGVSVFDGTGRWLGTTPTLVRLPGGAVPVRRLAPTGEELVTTLSVGSTRPGRYSWKVGTDRLEAGYTR